ncbi:hypothetical protein ABZ990_14055 [Streptomyces sp. NPDC046203]|uniref:hypothetical protein n=1 Tax=Streptomyces sp. NPDC046203 TaxID=3154602 RepID=UPI0033E178AB
MAPPLVGVLATAGDTVYGGVRTVLGLTALIVLTAAAVVAAGLRRTAAAATAATAATDTATAH